MENREVRKISLGDVARDLQRQLDINNEEVKHWFKFFTINGNLRTIEKGYTISLPHKNTKELAKSRFLRNIKNDVTGEKCIVHMRLLIGYDYKMVKW